MDYSKLYHTVKGEKHNTDGNFTENIDYLDHISERLRKTAMLENKLRYTREDSHSGSSDYVAFTSSSMRDRDLNHTQQIGHFRNQAIGKIQRIGNQK